VPPCFVVPLQVGGGVENEPGIRPEAVCAILEAVRDAMFPLAIGFERLLEDDDAGRAA
jgi:hypothetical protein